MPYTLKNKHFINQLLFGTQVVESAREEVLHGNGNLVLSNVCNKTMWKRKLLEHV